jgi:hypothetical protein
LRLAGHAQVLIEELFDVAQHTAVDSIALRRAGRALAAAMARHEKTH